MTTTTPPLAAAVPTNQCQLAETIWAAAIMLACTSIVASRTGML
jgi:hypothetical protein